MEAEICAQFQRPVKVVRESLKMVRTLARNLPRTCSRTQLFLCFHLFPWACWPLAFFCLGNWPLLHRVGEPILPLEVQQNGKANLTHINALFAPALQVLRCLYKSISRRRVQRWRSIRSPLSLAYSPVRQSKASLSAVWRTTFRL